MKRIALLFISFVVGYSFLYISSIIYIAQAGLSLAKYDALPFWCCVLGLVFLLVSAIASANDSEKEKERLIEDNRENNVKYYDEKRRREWAEKAIDDVRRAYDEASKQNERYRVMKEMRSKD